MKFIPYIGGWFDIWIALPLIESGIVTGADMCGVKNAIGVRVPYEWNVGWNRNGVGALIPWILFVVFKDTTCCAPGVIIS